MQRENNEVLDNEEKPLFTTKEDLYNYSKRDEIRKKEKDLFAKNFLEWFISEQLEEEQNAKNLIEKYENFGSTPEGLYLLDKELAARK